MVERVGRVFVAVPLPDEVRMALDDRLAGFEIPGSVAPPENWHITLRFLGSIDVVTYERFLGALDSSDLGPSFRVGLGELGAFPRPRNATVVWLGVNKGVEQLEALARVGEVAAQSAGLEAEERPFRSHLTLSRVRPPRDVTRLIDSAPSMDLEWRCSSILVYRSHLGRGAARYEPLESLSFSR
jgi:2'-5' RNA ligase